MMNNERMQTEHLAFIIQDILSEKCLKLQWQELKGKN